MSRTDKLLDFILDHIEENPQQMMMFEYINGVVNLKYIAHRYPARKYKLTSGENNYTDTKENADPYMYYEKENKLSPGNWMHIDSFLRLWLETPVNQSRELSFAILVQESEFESMEIVITSFPLKDIEGFDRTKFEL